MPSGAREGTLDGRPLTATPQGSPVVTPLHNLLRTLKIRSTKDVAMDDSRKNRRVRRKLIGFWAWVAVNVIAAIVVVLVHQFVLLVLVALIFVAPIIIFSRDGAFWQWSNSQPQSFRDWLHR